MKKVIVVVALALAVPAFAKIEMGAPFTDGVVLQRGRAVPVWGVAEPGRKVTVSFAGQTKTAVVSGDGMWRVDLDPLQASKDSRTLTITSPSGKTVLSDVVVGEVWLCSGQSNLEMAMGMDQPRYGDGIGRMVAQVTNKPFVRYLKAPDRDNGWHALTPEFLTSDWRSALAVHYALELYAQLDVPIGVAVAAVVGSGIDRWIPDNGEKADLYRSRVAPFAPYAVRGVLWYQGETDIALGAAYTGRLHRLYDGWRAAFKGAPLSFYYVQIAPYDYSPEGAYPAFAQAQARFADEEPNAALTVISDIGNFRDIHPNNKWLVAKRLALHALRRDYGYSNVEDDSPALDSAEICCSNRVRLVFAHAKSLYVYNAERTSDASFELAGTNGVWRRAPIVNYPKVNWPQYGTLGTNVVELIAEEVLEPVRVRHLWRRPYAGCLFNQVNLPTGAFSADIPYGQ